MFSGIVTGVGKVEEIVAGRAGAVLKVLPPRRYGRFRRGESLAVAGVCLTSLASGARFAADLSPETLRRTTLGSLRRGSPVNLERALRASDRLSGHIVAGHVDGTTRIVAIEADGAGGRLFWFHLPSRARRYVVEKGSIALDGVSLTVARLARSRFSVALVPHTLGATTFGAARVGNRVNYELDIVAKYVETMIHIGRKR
jgi:riboflavin synthase